MKEIPLTKGYVVLVDDEDFDEQNTWKWHYHSGYAARWSSSKGGKKREIISMHSVIANTPKGMMCDHINHKTLDNRRSNLRNCNNSENQRNSFSESRNKSGYKGVYWNKSLGKWHVQIKIPGGKYTHVGYFSDLVEAAKKYDEFARKYHGDFVRLNFPI